MNLKSLKLMSLSSDNIMNLNAKNSNYDCTFLETDGFTSDRIILLFVNGIMIPPGTDKNPYGWEIVDEKIIRLGFKEDIGDEVYALIQN